MVKNKPQRTVAEMTIDELRDFVKQLIEAERRKDCYVDDDGTLVFYTEEGYADYLRKVGKPPSKVKAAFLNEGGLKCRYSDYKLTPREKRRLERARKQIAEGKVVPGEVVFEELSEERDQGLMKQPWQSRFTDQAAEEMDGLSIRQPEIAEAIARRIRWLVENADFIRHEKMTGAEEYSPHIGQFRILYTLDHQTRTITIVDIGKHNKVYRRLQKRIGRRKT